MIHFIEYRILTVLVVWLSIVIHKVESGSNNPISSPIDPWYFGSRKTIYSIHIDYFKLTSLDMFNIGTFNGAKPIDNYQVSLSKVYNNVKQHNIIMSSFKCHSNYNFGIKLGISIIGNPTNKVNITVEQLNSTIFSVVGVSVIIVAEPFDKVMNILEFDMDLENYNYSIDFNYPTNRKVTQHIKSMNIISTSVGYNFELKFNIYSVSGNKVLVNYNSLPDKTSSYNHTVQLLVIYINITTKSEMLEFNFLIYDRYITMNPTFPNELVGIDTNKYGTDFNKKCIIGLHEVFSFKYNQPKFLFNLDPSVGLTGMEQNSINSYIGIQSYCFRDLECPDGFFFRKLGDFTKCYNCDDGVTTTKEYIPYCNNNSYDTTVSKVSYSPTGEITGYCNKCLNCENHYFAENGTCHLCNKKFSYCELCDETNLCLQCFPIALLDAAKNCILCENYINDCLECSSTTICLKCKDGFYLENSKCTKCSLTIDGCIECKTPTNCEKCTPPLVPRPKPSGETTCECNDGWRVTSTCTLIYGCISSHKVNDTVLCYACNSTANFMYVQGHNCVCKKGYYFNNKTKTCDAQCGDGVFVLSEGCDDGNGDVGDGCDSECNQEPNFLCQNTFNQESICKLDIILNVTVYSLLRKFGSSQLTLKLKFEPYHEFIKFNEWPNNVLVNTTKIQFFSYEFDGDLLVLHFSILETVEFDTVQWTLQYDSNKFLSPSQSLPILMRGQNAPLTLEQYHKQELILYIISYVLGGLSLVIGIVAMVKAESNIGFELCTTVGFLFYSRVLTYESNTAMLYTLGGLRTALGWNDFVLNEHVEYLEFIAKNRFYIKSELSISIMITLIILSLLLTIKLIMQFKHLYEQIFNPKALQSQQQLQKEQLEEQKLTTTIYEEKSIIMEYLKLMVLDYDQLEKKFITPIILISMFLVFSMFSAREIQGLRYDSHLSEISSKILQCLFFLIVLYYAGMIGCILGNFYESMEVEQPKKKKNSSEIKFKNYVNTYTDVKYLYLIVLAMFMLFGIDYKMETVIIGWGIEACLGVVFTYTITIILLRPYNDKLNQFTIISHEIIKILFLIFLFLLKKSILTELIQLIAVYFFLSLILLIEILSIIRIKKSWITLKTEDEIKKELKMKKNGGLKGQNDGEEEEEEDIKKKKKKYKKGDNENPYRYENLLKKENEEEKNMYGFMKDFKKKQEKDKEFNMLQSALEKGNLTSLLLGNNPNENNSTTNTVDNIFSKKQLPEANFIDAEITRRQRAEELRKVKEKMRKQTQMNMNSDKNIFFDGKNLKNDDKNSSLGKSPEKTWRPLTHEEELEKKYEYDVWRENNLERAMWEEEEQLRKKTENKKTFNKKYI